MMSKIILNKKILSVGVWLTLSNSLLAQNAATKPSDSFINDNDLLRYILVFVIALFVGMIYVLSRAIKEASRIYQEKNKEDKQKMGKGLPTLVAFLFFSQSLMAQTDKAASTSNAFLHWDVYFFVAIVILLFVVVLVLVKVLFVLLGIKKQEALTSDVATKHAKIKTWFQRFNETVPIEDEDKLDLQHNYDGIRELDNKVPSWWLWTFVTSILFGIVYIYRMFVSESMPNQLQELAMQNEIAIEKQKEFLSKSANNIDENNVVLLTGDHLLQGSALYAKNCIACHGDKGQGSVGPNLTDNNWIHKGGIKDIFYSIKYGWQDKGMKSWKDDFSPSQIADISSYVHSLIGTNPPNPKAPQGEVFEESLTAVVADTSKTTTVKDTVKTK